jgi:hypothetical protein
VRAIFGEMSLSGFRETTTRAHSMLVHFECAQPAALQGGSGMMRGNPMSAIVILLFVVLFISWLQTISYASRAGANRKPGLSYMPDGWGNPMNYLFRPDDLTAKGLQQRRLCFIHLSIFIAAMALLAFVGWWFEHYH